MGEINSAIVNKRGVSVRIGSACPGRGGLCRFLGVPGSTYTATHEASTLAHDGLEARRTRPTPAGWADPNRGSFRACRAGQPDTGRHDRLRRIIERATLAEILREP